VSSHLPVVSSDNAVGLWGSNVRSVFAPRSAILPLKWHSSPCLFPAEPCLFSTRTIATKRDGVERDGQRLQRVRAEADMADRRRMRTPQRSRCCCRRRSQYRCGRLRQRALSGPVRVVPGRWHQPRLAHYRVSVCAGGQCREHGRWLVSLCPHLRITRRDFRQQWQLQRLVSLHRESWLRRADRQRHTQQHHRVLKPRGWAHRPPLYLPFQT
jgi:hypothetical protein